MRKPLLLILCIICASNVALGQKNFIVSNEPALPPAYETIKGLGQTVSLEQYKQLSEDFKKDIELRRVQYRVGDHTVSAYVAQRRGQSTPLPVVIMNRGSYVVEQPLPFILPVLNRLARAGFFVVAPMLRGSDGMPGRDEMGGAEFADLEEAVKNVSAFGNADPNLLFMAGESRGGIMTFLAIRKKLSIKAAAVWGSITDMGDFLSTADPQGQLAHAVWPNFDQQKEDILRSRSAIKWADELRVPILIMHGSGDESVEPSQSLHLALKLQEAKSKYGLIIFANDNHVLRDHQEQRDNLMAEWFREHMK